MHSNIPTATRPQPQYGIQDVIVSSVYKKVYFQKVQNARGSLASVCLTKYKVQRVVDTTQ